MIRWERNGTRDRTTVGGQNEKTDLVPCGRSVERCTGHYVEHWYRKSGHHGPSPASRTPLPLPLSLRSVSFPCVLETLEVWEAPSHTLSPHSALNLIACVSAGKTFFDQFFIFPAVDSLTHCGPTREKKKSLQRPRHLSNFIRKCRWLTILPAITAIVNFLIAVLAGFYSPVCGSRLPTFWKGNTVPRTGCGWLKMWG